jgi:hypothetical protein
MYITCPFDYILEQIKKNKHKDTIITNNPNNGVFKHYWSDEEIEHVIMHLNNQPCSVTSENILTGFDIMLIETDGKNAEFIYKVSYGNTQKICRLSKLKKCAIVLRRII